jgi:hypothetical protein
MNGLQGSRLDRNHELATRVAKLIPRLGSTHDGEVIATVAAIRRTLGSAGLDLHDLARIVATNLPHRARYSTRDDVPDSGDLARWCCDHDGGRLTAKERAFVTCMTTWCRWREPTERQAAWLLGIAEHLGWREARDT